MLDQLTLLVDKSLVVAENTTGRTRYRLLETVRQYALEKLGESGEADDVRARHRDHLRVDGRCAEFSRSAGLPRAPPTGRHRYRQSASGVRMEPGNLRHGVGTAAGVVAVSALAGRRSQRRRPGMAGSRSRAGSHDVTGRSGGACSRAHGPGHAGRVDPSDREPRRVRDGPWPLAREVGDPALLIRGLIARGVSTYFDEEQAGPCFAEATELAQGLDDPWIWSQIYVEQARSARRCRRSGRRRSCSSEGTGVATAIGNHVDDTCVHWAQGWARA